MASLSSGSAPAPTAPASGRSALRGPLVLDGGLGTHLAALGADVTGALWSAQILREDPALIRRAHEDFLAAGAEMITSASYQVAAQWLEAAGADPAEEGPLLRASVRVAREAIESDQARREQSGLGRREVLLAASVGPFGAGPGPGTEYDGEYGLTAEELRDWHRPRVRALATAGADLLLAETIPSIREIEALAAELPATGMPWAFSMSIRDGRLADGTDLREAAEQIVQAGGCVALGVNCCAPLDAVRAVGLLHEALGGDPGARGIALMAYPNSGESWDHVAREWVPGESAAVEGGPSAPAEIARALRDAGASWIGGCCQVEPEQIREMAEALQSPASTDGARCESAPDDAAPAGAVRLHGRLICATDEEAEIVRRHLPEHIALTRAEPGCLRFDVHPTDDPLVWAVAELFTDHAAFDAHQARVRASNWGAATAGIAREYEIETISGDRA